VSWGEGAKDFSRADLERGINLAAEFPSNPFSEPFRKIDELVARKQAFETPMIKEVITHFRRVRDLLRDDAQAAAAMASLRARLMARDDALHAEVRAALAPVRHTVTVVAE
jgi:hypothetical protein